MGLDQDQIKQIQTELIITVVTTLVMIVMMYLYSLPEWKRRLYGRVVRERLVPDQWPEQLNIVNEMEMAEWRQTISRWIHDRTRDNPMGTRDRTEESN